MVTYVATKTVGLTESCQIRVDAENRDEAHDKAKQIFSDPSFNGDFTLDDCYGKDETIFLQVETKNPIGAECVISALDGTDVRRVYISFGAYTEHYQHDGFGVKDDSIFYYCEDAEVGIKSLQTPGEHAFIVAEYSLVYEWPLKRTYSNNGMLNRYKVSVSNLVTGANLILAESDSEEQAREKAIAILKDYDFSI